jgi:hypothetical protein
MDCPRYYKHAGMLCLELRVVCIVGTKLRPEVPAIGRSPTFGMAIARMKCFIAELTTHGATVTKYFFGLAAVAFGAGFWMTAMLHFGIRLPRPGSPFPCGQVCLAVTIHAHDHALQP